MRRSRTLALIVLVAMLWTLNDWAPWTPPMPADAQAISPSLFGIGNPQAIWYSTASLTVANTTAGVTLLSVTIPGSLFTTQAGANVQSINLGPANSSIPIHIVLEGELDTQATPTGMSFGVNYGVGTNTRLVSTNPWIATVQVLNGVTPAASLVGSFIRMDVWMNPIATGTATNATPNIVNTVYMRGRAEFVLAGSTSAVFNAATLAPLNIASAHILNVLWQFNAALNYLRIHKVLIKQGE